MTESGPLIMLFTDLVDSTELLTELGDDAAEEVRRLHFRLLGAAVAAGGGEVVKYLGDGLMAVFGSAVQAVDTAVAMQQAVARQSERPGSPSLQVRIGVHLGEPILHERDYYGKAVVIARRLCDAAHGGQILVSELVEAIVGGRGGFQFRAIGPVALKGLSAPIAVAEVAWRRASPGTISLPPPLQPAPGPPFEGREAEARSLRAAVERSRAGGLQLVLLEGDAGIGKTRLAKEVARSMHASGGIALFGRCDEETPTAYQPFVEALRHYVSACPVNHLRLELGRFGSELKRLLPELPERVPSLPDPPSGDPDGQRYRMFEAIDGLLREASHRAPVMLILDDLHWADRPTLLLLKHLARSKEGAALTIVVTCRRWEPGNVDRVRPVMAEIRRDHAYERMVLEGLEPADVRSLVQAAAGDDVPLEFVRRLHQETEGNPLFLHELLRLLADRGVIARSDGQWSASVSVADIGIPEGVSTVIDRRLSRLTAVTRQALVKASVLGRSFGHVALGRVARMPDDEIVEAMDEALLSGLVEEELGQPGRYRFSHGLVREVLYGQLSGMNRLRLHQEVAATLDEMYAASLDVHLGEVAHHYLAAGASGDLGKAVEYATRAGEQANSRLAYEDAADYYERARAAAELAETEDLLRICELQFMAGEAHLRAGRLDRAREHLGGAQDLAASLGAQNLAARAALLFGGSWWRSGFADTELAHRLEQALAGLGNESKELRVQVMARLAVELCEGDILARRESMSHQALALAREIDAPAPLLAALFARHYAILPSAALEEQVALGAEALALALDKLGPEFVIQARLRRFHDLVQIGDITAARAELAGFEALADELRQPFFLFLAAILRCSMSLWEGDLPQFEASINLASAIGQELQDDRIMTHGVGGQLGLYLFYKGLWQEALASTTPVLDNPDVSWAWRSAPALLHAELDEVEAAQIEFENAAESNFAVVNDVDRPFALAFLARACVKLKDADRANLLYQYLEPHARRWILSPYGSASIGPGALYLGMLARAASRWQDSEERLRLALQMAETVESPVWVAHAKYELAVTLRLRSGGEESNLIASLLADALTTARALGLDGFATKVSAEQWAARSHKVPPRP